MSYQNILEYGTFYYPAYKHYNNVVNVICDRCKTENLQACVGYGANQDLCLICVNQLTTLKKPIVHIGFPAQPSYHKPPINPYDYFGN